MEGKRPSAQGQGRGQLAGCAWSTVVGDCGLCSVHFSLAFFVPFWKGMRALSRGWGGLSPQVCSPKPSPRPSPGRLALSPGVCCPFSSFLLAVSACLPVVSLLCFVPSSPCRRVFQPFSHGLCEYLLLNVLWFLVSWALSLLSPQSLPLVQQLGGSVWTEAFPMTCPRWPHPVLRRPAQLPLPLQGLQCTGSVFPAASPTSPSFAGLETPEEGAPHPAPHDWPQPSLHTCPGPPWGSGAKAAS